MNSSEQRLKKPWLLIFGTMGLTLASTIVIYSILSSMNDLAITPDTNNIGPIVQADRRIFEYSANIAGPPDKVFPLLCPVLEYDWLDGWEAKVIYTKSGVAELGGVFKTYHHLGETWVVTQYDPMSHVQYTVFSGQAVMVIDVRVLPDGAGGWKIHWQRTYTPTTIIGASSIAAYDENEIQLEMKTIHIGLQHYLTTGEVLPLVDAKRLAMKE